MMREERISKHLKMVGKSVGVGLLAMAWLVGVTLLSMLAGVKANGGLYGSSLYFGGVTGIIISFAVASGFVVGTLFFSMTRALRKLDDRESRRGR